jgi:hypothetical protein
MNNKNSKPYLFIFIILLIGFFLPFPEKWMNYICLFHAIISFVFWMLRFDFKI